VILKIAITDFFNWIVDNGYFKIVELSALVHDEANVIYPKNLHDIVPTKLQECMEKAASIVCTKVPIPAEPAINDHWEH
jgi:DNA polymerase I-like protein with 3'-5' exonuclease and polymerase domains